MSKWIEQVFEAKIVETGGLVRRKKSDVHYYGSLDELLQQTTERGFHLLEVGDYYVVICNRGRMEVLC